LDVPRIGPPLDADDTPRRDRLVAEYNTHNNPLEDGLVQDTSGRGNDGIINSSVTYDSRSKEFDFAGDNDWIESPALGWTGAQPHSVSVWIKLNVMSNPNSTSIQNAWTIRKPNSTDAASRISELHIFSNGTIEWAFHGNNNTTAINKISAGTYYHIVCVYNGGAGNAASSRRMWINGVEETFATVSSTASAINFYDTATFAAGYDQGLDNYDLDGKMSSIKLYDTALTTEEVKTLYDMGRNGSVANPKTLQIASSLDVRGDIYGGCPVFFEVYCSANTNGSTYLNFDQKTVAKGGGWQQADLTKFYAPISGYYKFDISMMGTYLNGRGTRIEWRLNGTRYPDNDSASMYDYQSAGVTVHLRVSGNTIAYLNVGDWMGIYNSSNIINATYGKFTGFYLSN
jgi:hypothetical protein